MIPTYRFGSFFPFGSRKLKILVSACSGSYVVNFLINLINRSGNGAD